MNRDLPLESSGTVPARVLDVSGVRVDHKQRQISPCNPKSVGVLLGKVRRWGPLGVDAGLAASDLLHSIYVAELSKRIAKYRVGDLRLTLGENGPAIVALYGALHDAGEVFGGDLPKYLPSEATSALSIWQDVGRENIVRSLGLPLPSAEIEQIITAADWICPHFESRRIAGARSMLLRPVHDALPDWCPKEVVSEFEAWFISNILAPYTVRRLLAAYVRYFNNLEGVIYSDLGFSICRPGSVMVSHVHDLGTFRSKGMAIVLPPVRGERSSDMQVTA